MNVLTSYLVAVCTLILGANSDFNSSRTDVLQNGEWLSLEILDLRLTGPCYDVAFYQDGIIFLEAENKTTYLAATDQPDPVSSRPLFANKEFSCSPAAFSFSPDQGTGYYSRKIVRDEERDLEKIYEMTIKNEEVSDIRQISFANDSSRYLHPAVSRDGSMMVFASDRKSSRGGLDLFVTRLSAGAWSTPLNLGGAINSSGHEWFPFLDKHNNLWFSSTGHSGYGGYDIYFCPFNGTDWGLPRNLGTAINGPHNELGFSVHPRKQLALFSRTLPEESRGMAIMVTLNEEAYAAAEIDEPSAMDISLVMQGMANPASQAASPQQAEPETVTESEIKPESEIRPEPASTASPGQDNVVFRVQIISSLYENSFPTVFVEGRSYKTYEYFYLGSYRITVGKFDTLKEANAFRGQCLNSGFKQAFVAAFRGGKRETDPSVFKQ